MPVPASRERRALRAKIARASSKFASEKDGDLTELRREFKTQTIADYIKALVDEAPALTMEQRDRLALLLRGSTSEKSSYDLLDSVPRATDEVKEKPGVHAATRPE
ncbi:hypothetical protein GCM10010156_55270 [Planobispora rosea]|uniref:Uncharacterized protein n=1 Tax=Planobispora rosea TaxID=35762 RepID=A0A8J3WEU0_PLARO|nr:hypothetical protein [Planobispora rosea]GGS89801.1 hypothetical protein GCM10010156_55270 [Planobispora rosea]GIH86735.1 hypothetical protein Pro02_51430 [Planobispora rosea]